MGKELPAEIRYQAQELYCVVRLSLKAVAEEVGVAYTTVQRWAKVYDWRDMREKIAKAECDIRADTVLARSEMLKKLIQDKSPMSAFAVSSLESLAMKQAEAERAGKIIESATVAAPEIKTSDDMAKALRDAVTMKLNRMLNDPSQVDFKAVTDIQKASKIIEEMERKASKDKVPDSGSGVSADNLDKMLEALK